MILQVCDNYMPVLNVSVQNNEFAISSVSAVKRSC